MWNVGPLIASQGQLLLNHDLRCFFESSSERNSSYIDLQITIKSFLLLRLPRSYIKLTINFYVSGSDLWSLYPWGFGGLSSRQEAAWGLQAQDCSQISPLCLILSTETLPQKLRPAQGTLCLLFDISSRWKPTSHTGTQHFTEHLLGVMRAFAANLFLVDLDCHFVFALQTSCSFHLSQQCGMFLSSTWQFLMSAMVWMFVTTPTTTSVNFICWKAQCPMH